MTVKMGFADMRGEYDSEESEGQQVLRHLKAIVAWHATADSLSLVYRTWKDVSDGMLPNFCRFSGDYPNLKEPKPFG